jgi:mannose-6-phosphate isomerase-like protein (cupin superfamily)
MERGDGYTLAHSDEFERNGRWGLARRTLGVESFGINLVTIEPGKDIPEHDERERDQEEVYIILSGEAVAVVDGKEHPAPAGTYVRLDVDHRRTIRNDGSAPVELLMVSAPRSSGYEPMEWA